MKKIIHIIATLTVIGCISGGILAGVYQWALPKIVANQIKETDAAVFKVVPGTTRYEEKTKDDLKYFECFDNTDAKTGYAILCQGNGYQGAIKMMVGVNADFSKFTGLIILEQLETPGLGAKIAEAKFFTQFTGLLTDKPLDLVMVKPITGATISSKSVVGIINKAVEQWLK
ncbi:MAG: FMN-binding protein [bacterium]